MKVLLIEPSLEDRKKIRKALPDAEFTKVNTHADLVNVSAETFDAAIVDVESSENVRHHLKTNFPDLPILAIADGIAPGKAREIIETGQAALFASKDFTQTWNDIPKLLNIAAKINSV